MTRLELLSRTRTDFRKSVTKELRRQGNVPATVYGRGDESHSIEVSADELSAILKTPGGRLSLIDLKIDGKGQKANPVMIAKMQRDPITKRVVHVDFHRVSMNEPVHATVPLVFLGEAPGIKLGGIFEGVTDNLEIKALPDRIPGHIDVDVSGLEIGDSILVGDVKLPEGTEVLSPPADIIVATIRLPAGQIASAAEVAVEEQAPAE